MPDGKWIHLCPDELERICFALRQQGDQSLARRLAFRFDKSGLRSLDLGPRELHGVWCDRFDDGQVMCEPGSSPLCEGCERSGGT